MRKQNNNNELLEKLQNMPFHKLNPVSKNRLFQDIKESANLYEKSYVRSMKIKRLTMGFVCCTAILLLSFTAFTPQGQNYTGRLWAGITSLTANKNNLTNSNSSNNDTPIQINSQTSIVFSDASPTSIRMMDEQLGWAVGYKHIIRTSDGGVTWKDVSPKEAEGPFIGSYFLDTMNGCVAASTNKSGDYGVLDIYITSDGGKSWKKTVSPVEGYSTNIQFLDDKRGFILLSQGAALGSQGVTLLKTENDGASWTVISKTDAQDNKQSDIPFGGQKSGVTFRNAEEGFIAGFSPAEGHVYLYITDDGGRTWTDTNLKVPPEFKNAQLTISPPVFFTEKDGMLPVIPGSADRSIFFYTTHDGGKSWSYGTQIKPSADKELKWSFCDVNNIIASDGLKIYRSADGGLTWTTITPNISMSDIASIDYISINMGYIINDGLLYTTKDGGHTWVLISTRK